MQSSIKQKKKGKQAFDLLCNCYDNDNNLLNKCITNILNKPLHASGLSLWAKQQSNDGIIVMR